MPVWSSLLKRLPSIPAEWISQVRDWTSNHKSTVSLTVGAAGLLAVMLWIKMSKKNENLPPGPWGLPFLGAIHQVGSEMYKDSARLRKIYGDVFSLRLGSDLLVFVCGYPAIKEALMQSGSDFAGRPSDMFGSEDREFRDELFFADYSEKWKADRKFAITNLKKFGFGMPSLEPNIQIIINKMAEQIKCSNGAPIDLKPLFNRALAEIVAPIVIAGKRTETSMEYEEYVKKICQIEEFELDVLNPVLMMLLPGWFINWYYKKNIEKSNQIEKTLLDFYKKRVDLHKESLDPENPRDMLDMYLIQKPDMKMNILCSNLILMQSDNINTTAHVLSTALGNITGHPQVQSKLQEELDRVVGKSGHVTLANKPDLPYLQATILESYRYLTISPLAFPHKATRNATLQGYSIPKGTIIMPDLDSVHQDPDVFPNPDKFDPEHFLDKDGRTIVNAEYCIPFSVGRRRCLGESLAKMEVFLIIANLLHKFSVSFPPDAPPLEIETVITSLFVYKPYRVCTRERQETS